MNRRTAPALAIVLALCAFVALGSSQPAQAQTSPFSVLANFSGNADGGLPQGNMVQAPDGNFYGEDIVGGTNNAGVVYRLTPSGTLSGFYNPASGAVTPNAISIGGDGFFYATLSSGGAGGYGSVIKISPAGVMTTIHNFTFDTDGAYPTGVLVQGSDGNYYGEASAGGKDDVCEDGGGTIFKITPAGAFSVVYTFNGTTDGCAPQSGLVQGLDGNYYGMTGGTFFKYVLGGALSTIGTITTSDQGAQPFGPLVEDGKANFYVVESVSGANGQGTILEVSVANGLSLFYTFCSQANCADGGNPTAPLFLGTDGNFYGSTFAGSDPSGCAGFGCGTLFNISTGGTLTVLDSTSDSNLADGALPTAQVIQGSTGDLYTAISHGGTGANSNECGGDNCGVAVVANTGLIPPVQLSLGSSTITPNTAVTLSYKRNQATTVTSQQCYAFVQGGAAGAGTWTGKQPGTYSSSTHAWSGSASITPTVNGTYTYALTCGGNVSGFATLTVGAAKKSSATTLTATPSSVSVGQPLTLKATVSGSAGTPTGSVTFSVGSTNLATEDLTGGSASLPASSNGFNPGSYPIVATYSGSSTYNTSASTATTVTLTKAPTTTTLTASPNPVTPPATITLTATVKRSASGATGVPAGTVTFSADGEVLGKVGLNANGVAKLSAPTSGVGAGTYPVTATYAGDSSDTTSVSGTVSVVVK